MNIIKNITERMIENRDMNKAYGVKTYATEAAAEKATAVAALQVGKMFDTKGVSADYLVFYVEAWGRWVGAINATEVMHRPTSTGGYLGVAPDFYKF